MKFISFLLLVVLCCSIQYEYRDSPNCGIDRQAIAENDSLIAVIGGVSMIANEPLLQSGNQDTYRLIKSSAFWGIGKEIYTLTKENESFFLRAKEIKKGDIVRDEKVYLTEKQWAEFDGLVQEKCFWVMPCIAVVPTLDGTNWSLEVYKLNANEVSNRHYHVVFTNSYSFRYNMGLEVLCHKLISFDDCEN